MALFSKKQPISPDDLATGLTCWWSERLLAKPWTEFRKRLPESALERYDLESWIVVLFTVTYACQRHFVGDPRAPAILNTFHRLVYSHMHQNGGLSIAQIQELDRHVRNRYAEYYEAMKHTETPGPLWHLAQAMVRNLFGEGFDDPDVTLTLTMQFLDQTTVAGKEFLSRFEVVTPTA